MRKGALLLCALAIVPVAAGSIFIENRGPVPPPATIGPWQAIELPDPDVPDFTLVDQIKLPDDPSKGFAFNPPMEKRTVPGSWGSWSYGYTGPVYWSMFGNEVEMKLNKSKDWIPVGFSLAAEPNAFGLHQITVTATTSDGQSVSDTRLVEGLAGANRWNIWTADGKWLESVKVTAAASASGFAVGDFALASIPEPASLTLLALGGLALIRRR